MRRRSSEAEYRGSGPKRHHRARRSTRGLQERHPSRGQVVVFTMHDDPMIATRALKAGATAFVTKTSAPRDLVEAVRRAAQGE
jgi:two-component system invasion response regulator UvrY